MGSTALKVGLSQLERMVGCVNRCRRKDVTTGLDVWSGLLNPTAPKGKSGNAAVGTTTGSPLALLAQPLFRTDSPIRCFQPGDLLYPVREQPISYSERVESTETPTEQMGHGDGGSSKQQAGHRQSLKHRFDQSHPGTTTRQPVTHCSHIHCCQFPRLTKRERE